MLNQEIAEDSNKQIARIVEEFTPHSNVIFQMENGVFSIFTSVKGREASKEEALRELESDPGWKTYIEGLAPDKLDELLQDAQTELRGRLIGGIGITDRSLHDMDKLIPGLSEKIKRVTGKIVILGNGLSLASQEILEAHQQDSQKPEIILVDIIDYGQLVIDLFELKQNFNRERLPYPPFFLQNLDNAKRMIRIIRSGQIKYVPYLIGHDPTPNLVTNADIVLNIFGPEVNMGEQLSLLKVGGELISNYEFDEAKAIQGFKTTPVIVKGEKTGSITQRIA